MLGEALCMYGSRITTRWSMQARYETNLGVTVSQERMSIALMVEVRS